MDTVESTIFSGSSRLRHINLNGNTFSDKAAAALGRRFSTMAASNGSGSGVISPASRPPRVTCRNCSLVLDSTARSVEFGVEVLQCSDAARALITHVLSNDPVVVDASQIPLSEDELRWLCHAIAKVKNTRGIKMLSNGITDIGASY
jgi:hypothetical protein